MRSFVFHRIGSDPEGLFIKTEEFTDTLVPAPLVVGKNKTASLQSFIGTDGHAATAEFRPNPSHNIYRHLYDLAAAVHETYKVLETKESLRNTFLTARPVVLNEPLGGHIHLSFFVADKLARELEKHGCFSNRGEILLRNSGPSQPGETSKLTIAQTDRLADASYRGDIFELSRFIAGLSYLMTPFEMWIQPWHDRVCRNGKYGNPASLDTLARNQLHTPRPSVSSVYDEMAWFHMEFRAPSTWLVHPWLAYCYLALAKLSALNWDIIIKEPQVTVDKSKSPNNQAWQVIFNKRLDSLESCSGWQTTKDCGQLRSAIRYCDEHRAEWWGSGNTGRVVASSWRKLLVS